VSWDALIIWAGTGTSKHLPTWMGRQLEICHEYAQSRGYTIVAELSEDERGAGGADFDLPKLQETLEMARQGAFNVLVVRELDRLARSLAK
jgi:DNA invertase Pin-like site-specific DNA recombinase